MKINWILHKHSQGSRVHIGKINEDTAVYRVKNWHYRSFNHETSRPTDREISTSYLIFRLVKVNGKIGLISSNYTCNFPDTNINLNLDFWPYVSQIEAIYKVFPEVKGILIYPDERVQVFHNPVKDLIKELNND